MGLNDDEEPRIQLEFTISEVPRKVSSPEPSNIETNVVNSKLSHERIRTSDSEPVFE